jgi:hypothetical protein
MDSMITTKFMLTCIELDDSSGISHVSGLLNDGREKDHATERLP